MIKFFRKIRQQLLTESKFSKYLIYAIGEIVLVVIGILIALQLNTWNENRKQNTVEQDYLIALKKEFENNIDEVNRVIELNSKSLENAKELATYTGPDIPNISEEDFSKLYFEVIASEVQYRPGSGVIREIINSGKLNIFRNNELKNNIANMDGLILRIRFQENVELALRRSELTSLGDENMGMRRMAYDTFVEGFGLDKGKFLESNLHMLSSQKFDNVLTAFIYASGFLDGRYKELKAQLQKVIEITEIQIK